MHEIVPQKIHYSTEILFYNLKLKFLSSVVLHLLSPFRYESVFQDK